MRKTLGICVVALLLAMPLIAGDVGSITAGDAPLPVADPGRESVLPTSVVTAFGAVDSGTVHRTVVTYEPYTIIDSKTGVQKTEYRQVQRVVSAKVPTDPVEIESLRKRLKELHERRIESLTPAELATEVFQGAAEEKEREAWAKLQEARSMLRKISEEFPNTRAARAATSAQSGIPDTYRTTDPDPTIPASLSQPTPIKGV